METPAGPFPESDHGSETASSRRFFVLAGALFLTGCATRSKTVVSQLPDPWWSPAPLPTTPAKPVAPSAPTLATPSGVISRSNWAGGNPVPSRMNRNRPITRITLHHDGMQPFTSTSTDAAAARLESIRRSHLQRRPQRFGDIGYHYAIDPAGRVWCCRPLGYQGAHVAGKNPGNLGIVVLGNYDRQSPNRAQKAAILSFISSQASQYSVPVSKIRTHQELAATACPGKSMQRFMVNIRSNGSLG